MAKNFETLEEALEAQSTQKKEVEKVKKELTNYFTKNKLKRNEDYTDDSKHGPKIAKIEKEIDKKEETMAKINSQVKDLEKKSKTKGKEKAGKTEKTAKEKTPKAKKEASGEGRVTKYDYPSDCDTSQKKKAYRVAARAAEKAGKPLPSSYKEVMEAKSEKAAKKEPKAKKEEKTEKPAKEKAGKKVEKKSSKKEEKPSKEKAPKEKEAKKKKTKKVEDD